VPNAKNANASIVAVRVVGILALLSLLLFIRIRSGQEWVRVSLDASHGAIFAGVAICLALLLAMGRRRAGPLTWPDWAVYARSLAISVALGILIEFLQGIEGRPPSFFDVMTDTAGALAGLSAWTLATRPATDEPCAAAGANLRLLIALGLAGVAFVLWRPIQAATAYAHRTAVFPAIAEFSSQRDLYFVTTGGLGAALADLPAPWSQRPGERALEVRYGPGHPPAVQIVEPQGDWRGYEVIAVDLTNSSAVELQLVLRIHDETHDWSHGDRLNLPVTIAPGARTTIRVALAAVEAAPASRRMDTARIANVMLFGNTATASGALYVSRIWLE